MPRFLVVYTMKPEDVASFRNLPKAEQDAIDAAGIAAWEAWQERNAAVILEPGGMVGKTTRITTDGIVDAVNNVCGSTWWSKQTAPAMLHACLKTIRTSLFFRATASISCRL